MAERWQMSDGRLNIDEANWAGSPMKEVPCSG
jgi:hypothetical protein